MHGPQAGNYLFAFPKGQTEVKVAEHQGFDNIFYLHEIYLNRLDFIYLIMQQTGQLLEAAGLGPIQMAGAKESQIEKSRCVQPQNLLRMRQVGHWIRELGDGQVPSEAAATKNIVTREGPPPVLVGWQC
jgi:hypothetical protein